MIPFDDMVHAYRFFIMKSGNTRYMACVPSSLLIPYDFVTTVS